MYVLSNPTLAACAVASIVLASCNQRTPPVGMKEYVTGSVTYVERIAVPPNARLSTKLIGIGEAGRPNYVVAMDERALTAVPSAYSITYEPNAIAAGTRYGVTAEIRVGEELWFESKAPVPVLTQGAPNQADLVLKRTPR